MERKEAAFLRHMHADRLLRERIEQVRLKERRRIARSKASQDKKDSVDGDNGLRNSAITDSGIHNAQNSIAELLGPIENYLHLIDPSLRESHGNYVDRAQQIVSGLDSVADVSYILATCRHLLENKSDIDGEFLENLVSEVKKLALSIERSSEDPVNYTFNIRTPLQRYLASRLTSYKRKSR